MKNYTKADVDPYDWRDDLGMIECAMPPSSHLWPAVHRLRSHFEAVEKRAIDATGMLDKVKETVTKPAIRVRVVQATRTDLDRITIRVDLSDAIWLEDLAETAMHTRTVRFALRRAPRMEPTRFEVVEAERDPKKPTSDAVEEGDWTLHLNTVGFEHTPDGAFYLARIVSERVVPKAMNDELRAELERIDADVDRRAHDTGEAVSGAVVRLSPERETEVRARYRDGSAAPAEAYALGMHDAVDAIEKGLAAFNPTVDALLEAIKSGGIVAKVAAGPNGIAVAFAAAEGGRQEALFAKADKPLPIRPNQERAVRPGARPPPGAPFTKVHVQPAPELAGVREAENDLQKRLVVVLEEECVSESIFPLEERLLGRIIEVVLPASPDNLPLAEQKAKWFVDKCMAVFERWSPARKRSHDDLVALVADIASGGRSGQAWSTSDRAKPRCSFDGDRSISRF